jgi:deoxycytidine triphosphate deaminase
MSNSDNIYDEFDFAKTFEEAEKRSIEHRYIDPLPNIKPALLNRSDIANYVSRTGMIFPFIPNKLKPASYEIELGDEVLYWDEKGEKTHLTRLTNKNTIKIRRNSITYVGVAAKFHLPFYIALRFNLSITHVHRGLLLGTGPLIDPGFKGKLMIPIHNLTTNDYSMRPGDDLIAVEFTKLSKDKNLKNNEAQVIYGSNVKKPDLSFDDYIKSAIKPLKTVESSLEQTIARAEAAVKSATEQVEKVRIESNKTSKIITVVGVFTAAALVIATIAAFFQTRSLILDAHKYVTDAAIIASRDSAQISEIKIQLNEQSNAIMSLKEKIISINQDIDNLKKDISKNYDKNNTPLQHNGNTK